MSEPSYRERKEAEQAALELTMREKLPSEMALERGGYYILDGEEVVA